MRRLIIPIIGIILSLASLPGSAAAPGSLERVSQAFKKLYDDNDNEDLRKISGSQILNCSSKNGAAKIDRFVSRTDNNLIAFTPDQEIMRIYAYRREGLAAKNITASRSANGNTSVELYKMRSIYPLFDETGGVYHKAAIWKKRGRYLFLVVPDLPAWTQGDTRELKRIKVEGFCSITLS